LSVETTFQYAIFYNTVS